MALTKTSRYALRILGHMAKNEREQYSASELHESLEIPEKYMRRLLTRLSQKGFIKSSHGRNGGYSFTRDIATIRLGEIIDAVEGLDSLNSCILGYDVCAFEQPCPMHKIWEDTRQKILSTLDNTSLKDINLKETEVF